MQRDKTHTEQLIVHVPPPLRNEIKEAATREGRSVSNMARRILESWIAEHQAGAAA